MGTFRKLVAIKEVARAQAVNGPYLRMVLTDGEVDITAKYWQYPEEGVPCSGTVYQVVGSVVEYNGAKEVHIKRMVPKPEEDLERFRQRPVDPEEYYERYMDLLQTIIQPGVVNVIKNLLEENKPEVLQLPAAKRIHHNYPGGWLQHSVEVAEIALASGAGLDADLLVAGGLLHDIGKIDCYYWRGLTIQESRKGQLHGHIPLGHERWALAATGNVSEEYVDLIGHIILAHHGRLEWGSPVEPRIPEAMVVHQADMISSRRAIMKEAIETSTEMWTPKVFPLGVSLYAGESRRYRNDTREFIHEL